MIALCREHHDKAGVGAYTKDQLRELKAAGDENTRRVSGRFDWQRRDLVFAAGKFWFHEAPNLVVHQRQPIIWYGRRDGCIQVSLRIPGPQGERLTMLDNVWFNLGDPVEVHCPPSGHRLKVKYGDGDMVDLHFRELPDRETAAGILGQVPNQVPFPSTFLTIQLRLSGLDIDMRTSGDNRVAGTTLTGMAYMGHCNTGIVL